jgi:chromate transporter
VNASTLPTLAGYFALLSFFAIGGANAALPEMHRVAVETMRWMTDQQFADMYAIAQVSPGPNLVIVTLIGYHVAGIPGALVTTVAMCAPTCALAYFIGGIWDRFRDARWRTIVHSALVPVTIGLVGASAVVVTQAAARSIGAVAIAVAAALAAYTVRVNPLWIFAAAALAGLAGII